MDNAAASPQFRPSVGVPSPERSRLPHLIYISDVPVEASYHGSLQLYRLMQGYPAEKLSIVETGAQPSQRARRLVGVSYHHLPISSSGMLNTRFHSLVSSWFTWRAPKSAGLIQSSIEDIRAEAVLTVAHGYGWIMAREFAREKQLPLHLIVHDDWPRVATVPNAFRTQLDREFGRAYRQAQSRMCISPFMNASYQERYGKPGTVLYPSRAAAESTSHGPIRRKDHPFTIAFAGSINSPGYVRALGLLAEALQTVDGQLIIFGPLKPEEARMTGLTRANIHLRGLFDSHQLLIHLREEADALFVPMSFEAADRTNMEMAFPSKLADCTAVGSPLLIYGPAYCSAVSWARENDGVAEIVDAEVLESLVSAVGRLAGSPVHRTVLGTRASEVGAKYFGHSVAKQVFHSLLTA
jgi:hypothetical protein